MNAGTVCVPNLNRVCIHQMCDIWLDCHFLASIRLYPLLLHNVVFMLVCPCIFVCLFLMSFPISIECYLKKFSSCFPDKGHKLDHQSRAWDFCAIFYILWHASGAKCGYNMVILSINWKVFLASWWELDEHYKSHELIHLSWINATSSGTVSTGQGCIQQV